jgi:hypothetical protein
MAPRRDGSQMKETQPVMVAGDATHVDCREDWRNLGPWQLHPGK